MLVIPAFAKINLALEVTRRREDGWHDIESVLVPIDWHDLVGVRLAHDESRLRVTGVMRAGIPGGGGYARPADNLVVRAGAMLLEATAASGVCFDMWLEKRVPVAGGLGGGSADAAGMLRSGQHLLRRIGLHIAPEQLRAAAALLGSDVPALLSRRAVLVSGRGEQLAAIDVPQLHLVVAFLGPSSTRDAYHALQPDELSDGGRVAHLAAALAAGEPVPDGELGSALEAPALRVSPELGRAALELWDATPGVRWHMTGSGGCFFAVVRDRPAADELARRLRDRNLVARACRTLAPNAAAS
ncbi:MAG TPA: hypothetical protein VF155_10915 [Candidatus Dormibacteraeota bacterium]